MPTQAPLPAHHTHLYVRASHCGMQAPENLTERKKWFESGKGCSALVHLACVRREQEGSYNGTVLISKAGYAQIGFCSPCFTAVEQARPAAEQAQAPLKGAGKGFRSRRRGSGGATSMQTDDEVAPSLAPGAASPLVSPESSPMPSPTMTPVPSPGAATGARAAPPPPSAPSQAPAASAAPATAPDARSAPPPAWLAALSLADRSALDSAAVEAMTRLRGAVRGSVLRQELNQLITLPEGYSLPEHCRDMYRRPRPAIHLWNVGPPHSCVYVALPKWETKIRELAQSNGEEWGLKR